MRQGEAIRGLAAEWRIDPMRSGGLDGSREVN